MLLSVVIPVLNERTTLPIVIDKVREALSSIEIEIIVVDDGSSDGTREWLKEQEAPGQSAGQPLRPIYHDKNRGKGAAVRTGFAAAKGDILVVQDADLEYDPSDLRVMWNLIAERQVADVVFGCRFHGAPHRSLYFHHYMGNRLISFLYNSLYNQFLLDIEVGYKMFRRQVLDEMSLTLDDFGFEVEFSAKVARAKKWRIYEVQVSYFGRTYAEGKKISWRDGILALWYLLKFRLVGKGRR